MHNDNSCHPPRMRGIQYAAAYRLIIAVSGILDRPHSRTMTTECETRRMGGAQRYPSAPVRMAMGIAALHPSYENGAISRRIAPEVCISLCPPREQRAQGRPGACCTRGLACDLRKQMCTRAYRAAGASRPSLRNGFTAYFVLSPVGPGSLSPSPAESLPPT